MAVAEKLFVYGPWCTEGAQFKLLAPYVEECVAARIRGTAYRTEVGYPVVTDQGQDWVSGQVVALRSPDVLWRLLEDFHMVRPAEPGIGLFARRRVLAFGDDDQELGLVEAFLVTSGQILPAWSIVPNGDWRQVLRDQPPLPETMTERQRSFVCRLGRSTGREIIPIDLDLYRQLMKLQLIVDKGRRLALSPLGREVLRYLQAQ